MTLNRFLLLFAILIGSTLAFLSFTPPQTGKWVYMWQAYVWPKNLNGHYHIQPSSSFAGKWNHWDSSGRLNSVMEYRDGKMNGKYRHYFKNGNLYLSGKYHMGRPDGISKTYTEKGLLISIKKWDGTTNKAIIIYTLKPPVDRRAEFGIPIE